LEGQTSTIGGQEGDSGDSNAGSPTASTLLPNVSIPGTQRRKSSFLPSQKRTNHVIDELFHPDIAHSTWRHTLAFHLDTTGVTRGWELLDAVINLAFCALYIANTTFTKRGLPPDHRLADHVLAAALMGQYTLRILIAVDWNRLLVAPQSLLTWIACVPVFVTYWDPSLAGTYMSAGLFVFLYPFRFMRLHLSILACLVRLCVLSLITFCVADAVENFNSQSVADYAQGDSPGGLHLLPDPHRRRLCTHCRIQEPGRPGNHLFRLLFLCRRYVQTSLSFDYLLYNYLQLHD
jgi:hypothetical protein